MWNQMIVGFAVTLSMALGPEVVVAQGNAPIVRIFEFVIAQGDVKQILDVGRINIETSVRDEPGVLSMYCVLDKEDPTKMIVVEVYRDPAAYQSHVDSAHFKAFIVAIQGKVISRQVTETHPAALGAKAFNWPGR